MFRAGAFDMAGLCSTMAMFGYLMADEEWLAAIVMAGISVIFMVRLFSKIKPTD